MTSTALASVATLANPLVHDSPLRVLVACEYSGRVRDAFTAMGHYALSVDFEPTETPGNHYQGDIRNVLEDGWDLMVAHPPCTYLTNSGVRWLYEKQDAIAREIGLPLVKDEERWANMAEGAEFFRLLLNAPIPRKAIENPVMHSYARELVGRKADQYVQPWQFGQGETKRTGLWLENLPPLRPTKVVSGRAPVVHHMSPGPNRWKDRSRTYQGIADAMAAQWGQIAGGPTYPTEGVLHGRVV